MDARQIYLQFKIKEADVTVTLKIIYLAIFICENKCSKSNKYM